MAIDNHLPTARTEEFHYIKGHLYCEETSIQSIVEDVETPAYIYSARTIDQRVRALQSTLNPSGCQIYFAVKACSNIHILRLLGELGCGADIVSGGELFRALKAGIPANKIVFSGVGKSPHEIHDALKAGIHSFNVESFQELIMISRLAEEFNANPQISLRVNPDVDPKTHPYISTGLKKNKFGLSTAEVEEVCENISNFPNLNLCGLSCHIGSQILTLQPLIDSWKYLLNLASTVPFKVTNLDLGGGLGIAYQDEEEISLETYGAQITTLFKGTSYALGIEPGRSLVGPAGIMVGRIVSVKKRAAKTFYVLDAGMNDLLRPALYGATHPAVPVETTGEEPLLKADLVGPVCETADMFQENACLPEQRAGNLIAFGNAGAYGYSMASQYNSRPRPPEILVDGKKFKVIRRRETYADLIDHES